MKFYAHSLPDHPKSDWEEMHEHEELVAKNCRDFLSRIHSDLGSWGELLGRWHDLGKYSKAFQKYLKVSGDSDGTSETRPGRVDHSSAGAQHAKANLPRLGRLIAYVIAGHHAGLADADSAKGGSGLNERLAKAIEPYSNAPTELLAIKEPSLPKLKLCSKDANRQAFQISLLGRMMFSALCDADFLATESFMSPDKKETRESRQAPMLSQMREVLNEHLSVLQSNADFSHVNKRRAKILNDAKAAASGSPGLFSLTVPTGGGKTLSSLAFALDHAVIHGLDRIIYAIPFTSIVEQTASVFRDAFSKLGNEAILEHHSSLETEQESRTERLATENWDSPLVVTTNVQLFDSLFANKTGKCRKLHRIARSVIILDEAQTIPVDLLEPTLSLLRELVEVFECTIVLCTATQPAIEQRIEFPIGLANVSEIIPDPAGLFNDMKRVKSRSLGTITDQELVDEAIDHEQFLCIVNTRAHAARLYQSAISNGCLSDECFHLSTLMCGGHRKSVLDQIRKRLAAGKPCQVFSTQLIEAGVDVDFPIVFRAMTGLDSIAQAAGRCNREGKRDTGELVLFTPAEISLRGYLKNIAETGAEVAGMYEDVLDPEAVHHYLDLHYWKQSKRWDEREVMPCFRDPGKLVFQYREAAKRFQMIQDTGQAVLIPWDKAGVDLEKQIRSKAFAENPQMRRVLLRNCQRHMVSVYENVYRSLLGNDIELLHETVPVLLNLSMYDKKLGLRLDKAGQHEPESLIA